MFTFDSGKYTDLFKMTCEVWTAHNVATADWKSILALDYSVPFQPADNF